MIRNEIKKQGKHRDKLEEEQSNRLVSLSAKVKKSKHSIYMIIPYTDNVLDTGKNSLSRDDEKGIHFFERSNKQIEGFSDPSVSACCVI